MSTLAEILRAPEREKEVVASCVDLVESEVSSKRGLRGTAVKAAFAVVKRIKPGFIAEVVGKLLPAFAKALEPFYEASQSEAAENGKPLPEVFSAHLRARRPQVADALLGVTDARIDTARPAVQKTYRKLRGTAKEHVQDAVPGLATRVAKFV